MVTVLCLAAYVIRIWTVEETEAPRRVAPAERLLQGSQDCGFTIGVIQPRHPACEDL